MDKHDVLWLPTLYSQLHLSTPMYSLGPDPLLPRTLSVQTLHSMTAIYLSPTHRTSLFSCRETACLSP